jgi:hypothetical protein
MCGAGKAERAERSVLARFFFGYFLCSNDKESNNCIVLLKKSKAKKLSDCQHKLFDIDLL